MKGLKYVIPLCILIVVFVTNLQGMNILPQYLEAVE